ncbi:MAG: prenyltransferase/squalene oxidase repeat-containing protein [Kiritimatiellia bacterium]
MDLNEVNTHLAEIAEMYGSESYFHRLKKLFTGLKQPRSSHAYKESMIEMQRLSAPLAAILMPALAVFLLIVLSSATTSREKVIETQIIEAEEMQDLQEIEEIVEPPEVMEELDVDIEIDTPDVSVEAVQQETTVSSQPAEFDSVMSVKSPVILKNMYGTTRSTGTIGASLKRFGGDKQTEAAVMKALRWLKMKQNKDGSWDRNKVAMTGLAILTFLAHGEKPGDSEEFGDTIRKALKYLIQRHKANKGRLPGNYDHPIATYAICEAYGMTLNPNVKTVAEESLAQIIKGQHPTGGWTYNLYSGLDKKTGKYRDDTSYMGWCAQALKAGKLGGLHVEGMEKSIKLAIKGFLGNAHPKGGFGYTSPSRGGLTATGTLCLQLLGASYKREVKKSLDLMDEWTPTFSQYDRVHEIMKQLKPEDLIMRNKAGKPILDDKGKPRKQSRIRVAKNKLVSELEPEKRKFYTGSPQYYYYYATQCKFHEGGKDWVNWNKDMKPAYIKAQKVKKDAYSFDDKKHDVGWWENADTHSDRPVMDTCLAALQLMVYYRYLPTTSARAVEVEEEITATSTDTDDIKVDVGNL